MWTKANSHKALVAFPVLATIAPAAHAADSYRWLTVTIETPWMIFLFLLPLVLVPLILMAILYWRYANRTGDFSEVDDEGNRRGRPKDERTVTGGQG